MRRLISALLVLAVLAALVWGAGALALRQGANVGLAALRAQGRGDAGAVTLAGFPAALALTLDTPRLHQGLIAWQADWVRLSLPTWAPWQLRLDLSGSQSLRLGLMQYLLNGAATRLDVVLRPNSTLALDRAALTASNLDGRLAGGGAVLAAESLDLALTATASTDYMLEARLVGLSLPGLLQAPYGLPERAESIEMRAALSLSAPLDRHAQATPPRLTALTLDAGGLHWGEARLQAEGRLEAGASGLAEGDITLTSPDWRAVLALALALRLMQPHYAAALARDLEPLADATGGMRVALSFRDGLMWLGPVPLGPAPYLQ